METDVFAQRKKPCGRKRTGQRSENRENYPDFDAGGGQKKLVISNLQQKQQEVRGDVHKECAGPSHKFGGGPGGDQHIGTGLRQRTIRVGKRLEKKETVTPEKRFVTGQSHRDDKREGGAIKKTWKFA